MREREQKNKTTEGKVDKSLSENLWNVNSSNQETRVRLVPRLGFMSAVDSGDEGYGAGHRGNASHFKQRTHASDEENGGKTHATPLTFTVPRYSVSEKNCKTSDR